MIGCVRSLEFPKPSAPENQYALEDSESALNMCPEELLKELNGFQCAYS